MGGLLGRWSNYYGWPIRKVILYFSNPTFSFLMRLPYVFSTERYGLSRVKVNIIKILKNNLADKTTVVIKP
jgi:hypothetical protein